MDPSLLHGLRRRPCSRAGPWTIALGCGPALLVLFPNGVSRISAIDTAFLGASRHQAPTPFSSQETMILLSNREAMVPVEYRVWDGRA